MHNTFRIVHRQISMKKSLIISNFGTAAALYFFSLCYAAVFSQQYTVGLDHWEAETTDSTSMHQSWAEGETDRRLQ